MWIDRSNHRILHCPRVVIFSVFLLLLDPPRPPPFALDIRSYGKISANAVVFTSEAEFEKVSGQHLGTDQTNPALVLPSPPFVPLVPVYIPVRYLCLCCRLLLLICPPFLHSYRRIKGRRRGRRADLDGGGGGGGVDSITPPWSSPSYRGGSSVLLSFSFGGGRGAHSCCTFNDDNERNGLGENGQEGKDRKRRLCQEL